MPTFVQTATKYRNSSAVQSFTIGGVNWASNNGSGNLIVICVGGYSQGSQVLASGDVTDGTNTYQQDVENEATGSSQIFGGIWSTIEAAGGAKRTLTFNPAGTTSHYFTAFVGEFSGIVASGYAEGATTGSGSSTNPTTNITITSGSMILGLCVWDVSAGTISPGANYTELGEEEDGSIYLVAASEYDLSGASQAVNWTRATAPWEIYACGYKAAGAAETLGWLTDGQSNRPLPHHLDKGVYVGY